MSCIWRRHVIECRGIRRVKGGIRAGHIGHGCELTVQKLAKLEQNINEKPIQKQLMHLHFVLTVLDVLISQKPYSKLL